MLVHVEGTRSVSARKPVETVASVFVEMAMAAQIPIVPVRLCGGLPVEPADKRLEFPVGLGRQDYWIGAPILPEELASLPLGERKHRVLEAINGMGPAHAQIEPQAPCPEEEKQVAAWMKRTGSSLAHATLAVVLQNLRNPGSETADLVQALVHGNALKTKDAARRAWLETLLERLSGPTAAD